MRRSWGLAVRFVLILFLIEISPLWISLSPIPAQAPSRSSDAWAETPKAIASQDKSSESQRSALPIPQPNEGLMKLIEKLKTRASSNSPFDHLLYQRVAKALERTDSSRQDDQEFVATAEDFAAGRIRASLFVAYLKDALITFEADAPPSLYQMAKGGDPWASYFLARAFLVKDSAEKFSLKELMPLFPGVGIFYSRLDGLALPPETHPYWPLFYKTLNDKSSHLEKTEIDKLLHEAASTGNPGAMALEGFGKSGQEAEALIEAAITLRFPEAFAIRAMHSFLEAKTEKQEAESRRLFIEAASLGYTPAMLYLAHSEENAGQAVGFYRKAAEVGDDDAMFQLGLCYIHGYGVAGNIAEGIRWYTMAAERGNIRAMFHLGVLYEDGRGVAKNSSKGQEWYQRAASLGHPAAKAVVGFVASP